MEYKYKTRGARGYRNSLIGIERASVEAMRQAKKDMINDNDCPAIYFNREALILRYTAIPPIIIFTNKL